MNQLVSIIIPTFNRATLIGQTLDSVLSQTYTNWQCIVVDDRSEDDTEKVVAQYIAKDARFQFIKRPESRHKGANACRNIGITKAKGDYLMFLDAEDTISTVCFEHRIQYFQKYQDKDMLVFSTQTLSKKDGLGAIINKEPLTGSEANDYLGMFLSYQIPWQISNPFWRRSVFEKYGGFDEQLARFQDVDLHTKMLFEEVRLQRIKEVDFYYHVDEVGTKFRDETFINRVLKSISYYIDKYAKRSTTNLSNKEVKELLSKMLLKVLQNFVVNFERPAQLNLLRKLAKKHGLLTKKQRSVLWQMYLMDKYRLYRIKGFGFYRLKKRLYKKLFVS